MLSQGATTISTEIGPAIDGLTDQFTEMWDAQGKGSKRLDDTVSNLKQWGADLVDIFSGVFGILEELWHTFGDDILRYVITVFDALRLIIGGGLRVIKGIINLVLALLRGDWSAAWDAIKDIVFGAFDVIKGMFKLQLAVWRLVFSVGWKIIRGVFVRAWEGIRDAVKVGIAALVRLVKALPGLLRSALSGLGALLRDLMVRAWNGAKAALGNALDWIVNQVRALPGHLLSIGKSLYNAGKSLIESFVNGLKQSPGFVSNIAGAVWDAVKGMINAAIDAINSALSINIDWPGPGSFSWHASIPHLQQGGRARNATLAMIGEGREPETVLPDSMLRGLLERTAGGAGTVGRLTITNWAEGTGYFQLVARGEVAGERAHRRDLRTMHA
jgi:phage-related protein